MPYRSLPPGTKLSTRTRASIAMIQATAATIALLCAVPSLHTVAAFAPTVARPTRLAHPTTTHFRPALMAVPSSMSELPILNVEWEEETSTPLQDAVALNKSTQPTPVLLQKLREIDFSGNNSKAISAALASTTLALMLLFANPLTANAAMSGGRMGGGSFRSSSPSMRMAPSRSSYSGGYSGGSYRSYSPAPRVSVGPTIVAPTPFYNPFFAPRPYYYGGGAGVMTYNRGPSFFDVLFFGGVLFAVANTLGRGILGPSTGGGFFDGATEDNTISALGPGTSVVQVSVALQVPNRNDPNSILSVLNRLAQTAKTDSRVGVQDLTHTVALELLRRKSSIVSASSSFKHFQNRNKAQRDYNALSIKERSKFEKESTSQFDGVTYSRGGSRGGAAASDTQATMAVVTLLLAIDGDSTKAPAVQSIADVEQALRNIATNAKVDDCLQTAEILWTPEEETEVLTLREVVADYPELRSV